MGELGKNRAGRAAGDKSTFQRRANLLTYDKNQSVSQSRYLSPPAYITPPPQQAAGGGEEAFTLFTLADAAWKSHLLEGRGEDHHHHCI